MLSYTVLVQLELGKCLQSPLSPYKAPALVKALENFANVFLSARPSMNNVSLICLYTELRSYVI